MGFTLAQHTRIGRRREIRRTLHVGLLTCLGTWSRGNQPEPPAPLTRADLVRATTMIREDLLSIYHPFTVHDGRFEVHYGFVFEVLASSSDVLVSSVDLDGDVSREAEREGVHRSARSVLFEAQELGLENIALVLPYLAARPHGFHVTMLRSRPYAPSRAEHSERQERERHLGASGGLIERACNAMVLELRRDIESRNHTPAHETGHLLGLANASARDATSIMGPDTPGRLLNREDQRLLHALVELPIPGMVRPSAAQTWGTQAPHHFEGRRVEP